MNLFDDKKPLDFDVEVLKELTEKTRDSFIIHTMDGIWGDRSIFGFKPIAATDNCIGTMDFFRDPTEAPEDGDVLLVRNSSGQLREHFIFDVKAAGNPADLWSAHTVVNSPATNIGHTIDATTRTKRRTILTEKAATQSPPVNKGYPELDALYRRAYPQAAADFKKVKDVAVGQGRPVELTVAEYYAGNAFDTETEMQCHPAKAKGPGFVFQAAKLEGSDTTAMLVFDGLPDTLVKSWNSSTKNVKISGNEVPVAEVDAMNKTGLGGFTFKIDRVILVKTLG